MVNILSFESSHSQLEENEVVKEKYTSEINPKSRKSDGDSTNSQVKRKLIILDKYGDINLGEI